MKRYIGIDLGTTNSVICSYDGQRVQVWKSPEQNDVTPSAICVDRRGNRYYGRRASEMAPTSQNNAALLFKRYMGTQTRFPLEAAGVPLTPEECSAEILKVLLGYLPEDVRADAETAVVITVPAAFNQMKKDATLEAARLANIRNAALMQEPVAAVMSVMRHFSGDGLFLVYDLGGGTFDVSVAESADGQVSLLAQGGREMCGGRDWDRLLFERIIAPWLHAHFQLPQGFERQERYQRLRRLALFAAEQAKLELSAMPAAVIRMDEERLHVQDEDGKEIYLEIDIARGQLDELIAPMIDETVETVRATLEQSGLSAGQVQRIVFIGGPTAYKPLRDRVGMQLGVLGDNELNPMTAVAEGAAVFAESIDWQSEHRNRKPATQAAEGTAKITFRYEARCAAATARVAFRVEEARKHTVEITSTDTAWTSGRVALEDGTALELPLDLQGENHFEVAVYDNHGRPVALREHHIAVLRTLASVSSIPASYSVALKALDRLGGTAVPVYLVRANDPLPKTGTLTLKAGQALKAGSADALVFTLWEGDIPQPIEDNRYIGTYRIPGSSIDSGVIPAGAEIICRYEMADSGALHLGVTVPCIGVDFGERNFYSRQDGQVDLHDTEQIRRDGLALLGRLNQIAACISDPRLARIRAKCMAAIHVGSDADPEEAQAACNDLLEARKLIAQLRRDHQRQLRQMDLDGAAAHFDEKVRQYAQEYEREDYQNLMRTAQLAIARGSADFEDILSELRRKSFSILWKQDWYVIELFKRLTGSPSGYTDLARYEELKRSGDELIRNDWIGKLRGVVNALSELRAAAVNTEEMMEEVNVVRG